jgi:hypothetical protein
MIGVRERNRERERASEQLRDNEKGEEKGGRGLIFVQRPIQLCDATLSNLLLLQDFHDGKDEIPFDVIKKGTVCTGFGMRAHSCVHTSLSECARTRLSLSLHSFCRFHAFWPRVRTLSRSLALSLSLSLSRSVPSFLSLSSFSLSLSRFWPRVRSVALSPSRSPSPVSPPLFAKCKSIHACVQVRGKIFMDFEACV